MAIIKITSVDHAQEVLGTNIDFGKYPSALMAIGVPEKDIRPNQLNYELWLITEANNKLNNFKINSGDRNQRRYFVYAPNIVKNADRPSGLGLAFRYTFYWRAFTIVGARLEVGSYEEAEYIFKDFIEKWDYVWLIQE